MTKDELTGKQIFIRTVTHYYVGVLEAVEPDCFVMTKCVWIPETGDFDNCVCDGSIEMHRAYPKERRVRVSRAGSIDWSEWPYKIPEERR